ncbi:hypothetical protein P691DRAFT_773108 [Macrolepiota fuliginosa MF-IS2]|uniref:Uncharacterized protein n=1 Tax=Macrolepiota fuliginosa MF-IS2 TaxID=1400762 RepID=A0A9P5XIP2_9AGAR|nr:hypothetical protein P691DRAFT_773108 [Macrolepiota fuliginosa MF-IS2]
MFWFPILAVDTVLFLLAVGIVIRNWQQSLPESGRVGPSLVTIILRDNLGYFFCAFAIYLTTTVVWFTAEAQYYSIPACFSYSVVTIMGCRLILNLCDAYYNPEDYAVRGSSEWSSPLSGGRSRSHSISRRTGTNASRPRAVELTVLSESERSHNG